MTFESAHREIISTLIEKRLLLLERVDKDQLDSAVADAVTHEQMSLIEIRELLANHNDSSFTNV